jgi:site-specific recombinase XerD
VFLYRNVQDKPIDEQIEHVRAKRDRRPIVVMTQSEVNRVLAKLSKDPRTGLWRRHHALESGLQKAVKTAVNRANIHKRIGCHTFRHSFATLMLENGINIRVVQEPMGHANVKATEIYTHIMQRDLTAVLSPLDALENAVAD